MAIPIYGHGASTADCLIWSSAPLLPACDALSTKGRQLPRFRPVSSRVDKARASSPEGPPRAIGVARSFPPQASHNLRTGRARKTAWILAQPVDPVELIGEDCFTGFVAKPTLGPLCFPRKAQRAKFFQLLP